MQHLVTNLSTMHGTIYEANKLTCFLPFACITFKIDINANANFRSIAGTFFGNASWSFVIALRLFQYYQIWKITHRTTFLRVIIARNKIFFLPLYLSIFSTIYSHLIQNFKSANRALYMVRWLCRMS